MSTTDRNDGTGPTHTLADRVHAQISQHWDAGDIHDVAARNWPPDGTDLRNEWEMDVRDWGIAFGIAWAIARGEDPYESVESVADRASAAALEAFERDCLPHELLEHWQTAHAAATR